MNLSVGVLSLTHLDFDVDASFELRCRCALQDGPVTGLACTLTRAAYSWISLEIWAFMNFSRTDEHKNRCDSLNTSVGYGAFLESC